MPTQAGQQQCWKIPPGSADALLIAHAWKHSTQTMVVICADPQHLNRLARELPFFGVTTVRQFVDWETLPYDQFSPHPDIISDRITCLYDLKRGLRSLVLVTAPTLIQRLPPPEYVMANTLLIKPGDQLDIHQHRNVLESAGYRNVPRVTDPGEFAIRGALFDIYPMGMDRPVRVEFFDQDIETIRSFDPETQLSVDALDAVHLLPAREFPFDEDARARFGQQYRSRFDIDLRKSTVYQDARRGIVSSGMEYFLPLFFEQTATLEDYLPAECLLMIDASTHTALDAFAEQLDARHEQRRHDVERPILRPDELYVLDRFVAQLCDRHPSILWDPVDGVRYALNDLPFVELEGSGDRFEDLLEFPGRILVTVDSIGHRELITEQLSRRLERPVTRASWFDFLETDQRLSIAVAPLEKGFRSSDDDWLVITEHELMQTRASQIAAERHSATDPAAIIRNLNDLNQGAPVVHAYNGVGRYLGLNRIRTGDDDAEFLTLMYADGDKLYVPVSDLHLISRYTGASEENAPLHKLGSGAWEKSRRKAAEKARDVAVELLDIYARREAYSRPGFELDQAQYRKFANEFPFDETDDQLTAINAVVADLTSDQPMDRVVCGDVGFGKTEVAMRAAFVAAHAGHQVAILVPTTLLARQHYQNFMDRFADWPFNLGVLSRFNSPKENRQLLDDIAAGKIDIVIGTHRLLQKDIRFSKLGLMVIDEEQRFGVRQKEQLKKLRAQVDLLTLTATPIPRTLNMALSGIRDLSIIASPPTHRMAVKTFVGEWDDITLKDAIAREMQRGGQIYFLHNEVQTIERMAETLRALVPQIRLEIAHGQMPEKQLERVMIDFYRQRFNVLLCSTIIENGIDVPTANTIIINRADRFGLSQLHQLRGRVGRSHHRAYAYLLTPPVKAMTADARKRLDAIASMEDLGSGFLLATHDLEIRGAGELLGDGQSGQITEIGFSLYMDILERAVKALKSGKQPELDVSLEPEIEVDLQLPALIPDDYLPDVHLRLVMYKRIANAGTTRELDQLQIEMIDRFGLLPDQVKYLFKVSELRLVAATMGVTHLKVGDGSGRIAFVETPTIDPLKLIKLAQSQPHIYRFEGDRVLRFTQDLDEPEQRIRFADDILARIAIDQD